MTPIEVTPDEAVNKMQQLYPENVRVAVLTVANEKQSARIRQLEEFVSKLGYDPGSFSYIKDQQP
jgi:hypothetical protein